MRVQPPIRLAAAVLAVLAAAGCTSHGPEKPAGARSAEARSAAPSTGCPAAADTPPAPGEEPLPEEVRCLPGVRHGSVIPAEALAAFPEGEGLTGRALQVGVDSQTTAPEAALALCQELTRRGYGPGGAHHFIQLAVTGDARVGAYVSWPDHPACAKTG
ncbi:MULTISPECIES: hypothetical protein [Kitasatospora]|uniref:Lipoprotein n=1 Tax=Kitasatospora setae (strain ATCC 33774 / DSM 43861 / JCM 3304 / KCC A-0304 / NBRC 14216 / KM-6054) TaxID=452652 RepID=E4NGK7_KITSK|nr:MULTISPECIES: hypothetical protein [Kitasatospora]BAJ30637.1 hypothetical protein KSE_48590 [Kitasatospora setae KM-6054]